MDLIADILRRFGPMRTFEIISMSALSKSAAAVALSKLKRSGILVNPTRGTWAIARKGG
jgi:predicted transcriptional regulator